MKIINANIPKIFKNIEDIYCKCENIFNNLHTCCSYFQTLINEAIS